MAGMSLDFMVSGDDVVALELRGLGMRAADASPAFEVLEHEYETAHERWFRTRGSGTWPPLADATKKRKRREGLSSAPLFGKTSRLVDSLSGHTDESVRHFTTDTFVFGTQVPYARFHRHGTTKMPERNPLVRTVFLEPETVATLSAYLAGPISNRSMRRGFGTRKAGWWR